jgi:CheY-like chemotaxis protein
MYFIYVSNDNDAIELLEEVLQLVDRTKLLLAVPDGYELIQFLQNVKRGESYPDLIILSTHMPRMSGKEVLELLKIDDIYRLIPVVMLQHEINEEEEVFCKQLGTDTIIKPALKKEWIKAARQMCANCI